MSGWAKIFGPFPYRADGYSISTEDRQRYTKEFTKLMEQDYMNNSYSSRKYTAAHADENVDTNRYLNALPLDSTRVVLPEPSPSDYINASKVQLDDSYVCCQAPLDIPTEHAKFWLMLLAEHITVVVMLTAVEEGGKEKASRYWPESRNTPLELPIGSEVITVKLIRDHFILGDILVRRMSVTFRGRSREICQVQFLGWPDCDVPDGEKLANLVGIADAHHTRLGRQGCHKGAKPCQAVHCSAGVGRTGTYVLVREIIRRFRADPFPLEAEFDVKAMVAKLRSQRNPLMVQTVGQYSFLHLFVRQYRVVAEHVRAVQNALRPSPK
ncbi:Protein-tyrosine phosphatase [Carpediemonas membranifera]|uniref:Protein-tyrosine phosphatase n=1 Tax=Carpediemonas membranifera TaxID=201153 RepID=A0A8J6B5J0_9EUKA|nr:Protein-tyrosine phosphatase [Carpediemonas membranifera]|eukprot:KAG9396108.1 Protein-tyrosine phosphatase [Carpediemonas membranifera]